MLLLKSRLTMWCVNIEGGNLAARNSQENPVIIDMELIWKALIYSGCLWTWFRILMGHPNNVGASCNPSPLKIPQPRPGRTRLTLMSTSSAPSLRSVHQLELVFNTPPKNQHSPWKGTIFWEESNLPIMIFQGLCNLMGVFVLWWHIFSGKIVAMHALNILFSCFYNHQYYWCNDMSGNGINLFF